MFCDYLFVCVNNGQTKLLHYDVWSVWLGESKCKVIQRKFWIKITSHQDYLSDLKEIQVNLCLDKI